VHTSAFEVDKKGGGEFGSKVDKSLQRFSVCVVLRRDNIGMLCVLIIGIKLKNQLQTF
jgi:hypothetical protein